MSLSTPLRERRAGIKAQLDALVSGAESRADKNFSPAETARFDGLLGDLRAADAAIADTDADEAVQTRAAAARVAAGEGGTTWSVGGESATYRPTGDSFFADLINARRGDRNAVDRLARNNSERGLESRALGNTNATGGSGGEFAPPAWLVDEFVKLARPARVTADLFHKEPLPLGVSSINIPRISGGTAVAVQTTQNTTVAATDITTAALSSSVVTVAGKQVVSRQLLDQSGLPFDRVILQDLAADYARQVGAQAITGTGAAGQLRGYLTPASPNQITWTQASPTAGLFFSQLARLQGQIAASRFAPADTVVMHPRRWAWLASYMDSTGRPLVAPVAGSFNSMAQAGDNRAQGQVGSLLGMDVFVDPNISTTQGVGTNQDTVLMMVRDDIWLWESELRAEAFEAPYAESLGLLFRCFGYLACVPDRYPASLGSIVGTGLVAPVFAS